MLKKKKIYAVYISKHNLKRENQVILLMIPNGEGCHYILVEALSVLSSPVISKHDGIFVKIVFIQSEQKTNLKHIKK